MSEPFIDRAYLRLAEARNKLVASQSLRPAEIEELAKVVEAAINAVDDEGCLPAALCTAVVKYGKAGAP